MTLRSDDQVSGAEAPEMSDIQPRTTSSRIALMVVAGFVFLVLLGLGSWQLYRLQWKEALIARVEQRVHQPAVAAPGAAEWPQIQRETHEYLNVRLSGRYLPQASVCTLASTVRGSGNWLITPLQQADGSIVLINRGFLPDRRGEPCDQQRLRQIPTESGIVSLQGLLRITEPDGGFLRHNDAGNNRWFSRDVAAIAAFRQLKQVAPYFVDLQKNELPQSAPANAANAELPVAGLTVISFPNNHLVYALTWYTLALMVAAAAVYVWRSGRRRKPG